MLRKVQKVFPLRKWKKEKRNKTMPKPNIKAILKTAIGIGGLFAPKGVTPILDIVSKNILDEKDPQNEESLKYFAESIDQLTEVARSHEARLRKLEAK